MNVSRFFGSTSREAMRQVRMALGPDAMIVSNRRVNGGVEIMAADATSLAVLDPVQNSVAPSVAPASAASVSSAPVSPAPSSAAQPRAELMGAIGAMQGALESRIDELLWSHQLQRTPETISLFQSLLGYGFSTALLRAMLKRLPAHLTGRLAFEWARNELDMHLPVLASEDILWQPGCALALVGPTGVGKTTTIAKLAARCVKRFGADQLVLITTDTYRVGAHEQLKIYADILRVPVHVVQDGQALRQVMLGIRPEQIVLIDNVGISQRDGYVKEQAALLASSGRRVQRLLALNASSHGDTLDEVARVYKTDGGSPLIGCIVTKIDEASRIGPALDTAIRYQLPIHYVSDGQKVPENLGFLSARQLVDRAFAHEAHNARALYSPTSGDVAALLSAAQPEETMSISQAQRNEMLSKMLRASAGSTELTVEQLRTQAAALDQCLSLSSAFEYWRDLQTRPQTLPDVVQQGEALLRSAKHEANKETDIPALCVYQTARTSKANEAFQRLVASYVCGSDGAVLSSPQQQVVSETEWLSTAGSHVLSASSRVEHLKHAIEWAEQQQGQELMHAIDGGAVSLWQDLVASGTSFLAVVAPSTRVWHQNGTTTAKAVTKLLQFNAVADLQATLGFSKVGEPIWARSGFGSPGSPLSCV
ncbi:flagellar biosynthesis protein FlhF [Paenalcaligenes niemegkensis]|uniref:flagellar biosynthesis protein FlhF n=1 Tax=Paenalcaligenes niemegkensis TaxID=2895469 RepID=UPI001EE899D2|nr:flagellar biosynthesis protein FlhF [Paenalcaligenes niemegkensis]MCQ9615978.1 flagellar biosynthesis protein FlhF [Paenalcaligenes niemegkensis]